MKCIYGLVDLSDGEIYFNQEKVLGPAYNLIPGHNDMNLVSQEFYVLENHTVEENIWDKLIGYTTEVKQKRSQTLLKLLELENLRATKTKNLSSGQKQRVAIARSLAIIPKLLLLDEPFNNLDRLLSAKLFAFLQAEIKKNNTAVILITHMPEEALKFSNRIAIMHEGQIKQIGDKWQVFYRPKNLRLAGLLGEYNIIKAEDFHAKSEFKTHKNLLCRPNNFVHVEKSGKYDLEVQIVSCVFNGKCFEVLAETNSGHHLVIFDSSAKIMFSKIYYRIILSDEGKT
jgi:ABC-type Fe3+/spermidine/putrescine transport system ATPase subunit